MLELAQRLDLVRLDPAHLFTIERQPSQATLLGLDARETMTAELAQAHADQACAWTLIERGAAQDRIVACLGIIETFAGRQGFAWAILGADIGRSHHRLTRTARDLLAGSPLPRVEAYTRCSDIEPLARQFPQFDPWALAVAALAAPTPEMRWAQLIGFRPAHVLRRYGAADETVMLFERVI